MSNVTIFRFPFYVKCRLSYIYKLDEGNVLKDIAADPSNLNFAPVITTAIVFVYTDGEDPTLKG